jgi:hypothetical protein
MSNITWTTTGNFTRSACGRFEICPSGLRSPAWRLMVKGQGCVKCGTKTELKKLAKGIM